MTFRVGQKVVCVDVSGNCPLELNGVYTVALLGETAWGNPALFVEELVQLVHEVPFYRSRFRPLVERKTDISIFTAMLNPSKVGADA